MNRKAIEALKREVDWESDNDQTPAFSCGWNAAIDAVLALEDEPLAGADLTYAVSKKSDGDYPEDFSHENGSYFRVCTDCGNQFTGHKRRLICKLCAQASGDARKALDARDKKLIKIIKGYIKCRDKHNKLCDEGREMSADWEIDNHNDALAALDFSLPDIISAIKRRALTQPPKIEESEPVKIMQTVLGNSGNCMSACLASLMGLSIDEMPNFFDMGKTETQWWNGLRKWLEQYNLGIVTVDMKGAWLASQKGFFIVGGESVRGLHHAVLYKDGQLWHDPHPDKTGIIEPAGVDILYALNPLQPIGKAARQRQAVESGE